MTTFTPSPASTPAPASQPPPDIAKCQDGVLIIQGKAYEVQLINGALGCLDNQTRITQLFAEIINNSQGLLTPSLNSIENYNWNIEYVELTINKVNLVKQGSQGSAQESINLVLNTTVERNISDQMQSPKQIGQKTVEQITIKDSFREIIEIINSVCISKFRGVDERPSSTTFKAADTAASTLEPITETESYDIGDVE